MRQRPAGAPAGPAADPQRLHGPAGRMVSSVMRDGKYWSDATVEEVLSTVLGRTGLLESVRVGIGEADGMFIAADARAAADVPRFDNSAVDGYALNSADLKDGGAVLDVVEEVQAGRVPASPVGGGRSVLVMTGAPLPAGADCVVPVEDAARTGSKVSIEGYSGKPNLRKAGEIAAAGEMLAATGTRLGPADLALLASGGYAQVDVRRRPAVTVISTGDELEYPGVSLEPGRIWACNSYALAALAAAYGAAVRDAGILRDGPEGTQEALLRAIDSSDMVVTSGGVSAGQWDCVKDAVHSLCDEDWTWRINMHPGRPLAFGVRGGKLVFGLPGNPVAAMVSFCQFARAALLRMQGAADVSIPTLEAVLAEGVSVKAGTVHFLRARLEWADGVCLARPVGSQGSAIIRGMADADALLVAGPEKTRYEAGDRIRAQVLDFKRPASRPLRTV